MSQPFDNPRMAINRVYTRQGDAGDTALAGGQRVPKDGLRIEAYGTVDELNAFVGVARLSAEGVSPLAEILLRVQHELFNLGSILATLPEDVHPKQARITDAEVARLEQEMDRMNEDLEPLRSFVLPGGSRLNADLHVCRTVCRRSVPAEVVHYLNRLSDAFFVWSRWASHASGTPETLWQPNQSSSGMGDS
jgi:cob(I)alamin adenosyltransferase